MTPAGAFLARSTFPGCVSADALSPEVGKLAVLALAASLCVVSTAPSSGCQDFSSAKRLVDAVAVDGKNYLIRCEMREPFKHAITLREYATDCSLSTNMTMLQAAIARIFNTARSVDQGYFTRFAVGTKDAVSLEFVNCWAVEMSNNTYCQRVRTPLRLASVRVKDDDPPAGI